MLRRPVVRKENGWSVEVSWGRVGWGKKLREGEGDSGEVGDDLGDGFLGRFEVLGDGASDGVSVVRERLFNIGEAAAPHGVEVDRPAE